jgi:UDP-N-acetylglucosamine transferase subunit ALG13
LSSLVFVSVGTDHHPFDRLIGWVDAWLPEGVRCVVQHGTSAPPSRAEGMPFLDHGELTALLDEAAVVVSHGGPTTITESRRHGRRPIVVPRSPSLGEHVDDHQQRFCARMEAKGLISAAPDEPAFRALMDQALASPADFAVETGGGDVAESVARFGDLVGALLATRSSR